MREDGITSKACPNAPPGATLSSVRSDVFLALFSAAILAVPLASCQASVEANVNAGTKSDTEDIDKPLDARAMTANRAASEDAAKDVALLGARQDLSFHGPSTAACQCMEVALGQPGDVAFQWAGERPHTSRESQLVFAMATAGVQCPGASGDATGASYWGYEVTGDDVVVVVERALPGRPVATGAIIPRPTGRGQVYVRPADKKVPYGRAIAAGAGKSDRCQIGKLEAVGPAVAAPTKAAPPSGDQPSPFSAESQVP